MNSPAFIRNKRGKKSFKLQTKKKNSMRNGQMPLAWTEWNRLNGGRARKRRETAKTIERTRANKREKKMRGGRNQFSNQCILGI